MGSRCHYPFWDKGSVCAHLLSTHRCRTAQDISYVFGSHGWFSSNRSFLSGGGVAHAEYEMATRYCRYNHKPRVGSRSESTVARYIWERHNKKQASLISANKTLRRTSWSLKWVVAVLLLLIVPGSGLAQSPQNNWDNLKQLAPGQQVQVVLNDAKSYEAKFQSVTDDGIVVRLAKGEQTFPRQSVLRVSSKHRSHRGRNALIGAGVGVATALAVDAGVCEDCTAGTWVGDAAGCGLLGAAVGALVSKGARWHDVYRAR